MATIVTRETGATAVNRALTNAELDNNFINLNTDIGNKQPLDGDLTAIAALTGSGGLLKRVGDNSWLLDYSTYATQTYVGIQIANLVSSAPTTLDTLNELATALGNDANFSTTITTALGNKQPLDADLTAIAALSGTSGFLKKTAADTWALDTSTYLTSESDTLASVTGRGASTASLVTFAYNDQSDPLAAVHITGGGTHTGLYINPSASSQAHIRFGNGGTLKWQIRVPFQEGTNTDLKYYSWVTADDVFKLSHAGSGWAYGDWRAPIFYDSNDTAYYVDPNNTSTSAVFAGNISLNGVIVRRSAGTGYLSGNYSGSETTATTGAIYTIGGSYYPTSTSLNNMYGIGFTYAGVAGGTASATVSSAWGLYVASNGVTRVFLDSDYGRVIASGDMRAPIYYDRDDTGTYINPNGSSIISSGGSYPLEIRSTQRYLTRFWNTSVSGYGFWLANDANTLVFHADSYGDRASLDYSGNLISIGSMRSPIFYDYNDTTYYLDPNSTGTSLKVAGNIDLYARSASWAEGIRIRVPNTNNWGGIRWTRDRGNDDGNWALGYTALDSTDDFILWANNSGDSSIKFRITKAGTMTLNGAFNATSKSFLIDHPTKPGMKLRYGSLEGPENGVYIRGKQRGNCIELPDYWIKLVDPDSITVTLTPVGKHQKLYVDKIENNVVYVGNDGLFSGEAHYFYVVYAERVDVEKLGVEIPA